MPLPQNVSWGISEDFPEILKILHISLSDGILFVR
jgi:hypothetical protein